MERKKKEDEQNVKICLFCGVEMKKKSFYLCSKLFTKLNKKKLIVICFSLFFSSFLYILIFPLLSSRTGKPRDKEGGIFHSLDICCIFSPLSNK